MKVGAQRTILRKRDKWCGSLALYTPYLNHEPTAHAHREPIAAN